MGDPIQNTADHNEEGLARLPVQPAVGNRAYADACVVEPMGDGFEISFLAHATRVTGVAWPASHSQPAEVGVTRIVEEVAKVRISDYAANDLALNLLLEAANARGFDLDALDKNFAIIRTAVAKNLGDADGDR